MTFEEIFQKYKDQHSRKRLAVKMKTGEDIEGYVEELEDGIVTMKQSIHRYNSPRTTFRISQVSSIPDHKV